MAWFAEKIHEFNNMSQLRKLNVAAAPRPD
jgi:hypothetical protein